MSEAISYPRLGPVECKEILAHVLRTPSISEMGRQVSVASAHFGGYYPLRRAEAREEKVQQVRDSLVAIAGLNGYPGSRPRSGLLAFDREASVALWETMSAIPSDVASVEPWRWLTANAVPDLLVWRFGTWDESHWAVSDDRVHSRQKGFLGRLWWRCELLGPELARELQEDEAVQVLERARVTAYPRFARTLVATVVSVSNEESVRNRSELFRDVMKIILRRKAAYEVAAMSTIWMERFVRESTMLALSTRLQPTGSSPVATSQT